MKKIIQRHWLYLTYGVISVLSFFEPSALLLLIFIFPAILLFDLRRLNWLYSIFLIVSLNVLFFVFYMGLFDLLKIPLHNATVASVNLAFSLLLLVLNLKNKKNWKFTVPSHSKETKYIVAIYVLFVLAFIARVISIIKFPAPILHDPVADAVWTKSILQNHSIDYFYSPGLHLITAFFSNAARLSIPHALNLVTNSFSAFSVLSWGLVTLLVTRNGRLATFVALLTLVVPVPSELYYNSGKNSLVMAIAFIPVVFYLLHHFYKNQNIRGATLVFVGLASMFLIHYPTFGYIFLTILALGAIPLVAGFFGGKFSQYRPSRTAWAMVILVLVFLGSWFAFHTRGPSETSQSSRPLNFSQSLSISPAEVKQAVKTTYDQFSGFAGTYGHYFLPIVVIAVFYLLGQRRSKYWATTATFTFWIIVVPFGIYLLQLYPYSVVASSGVLLFFQVFVLVVALAADNIAATLRLERWSYYTYCLILGAGAVLCVVLQLHRFHARTAALETVNQYDLAAYNFINSHSIKGNFLINEAKPPHGATIFPTDGGMWLPVYTNDGVSDNFADFHQRTDAQFYKLYLDLSSGHEVRQNLDKLKSLGYKYYYYDRGVFGVPMDPSVITPFAQPIYSNSQVSIYKFTP